MHLSHGLSILALLSAPSLAVAQSGDSGQVILDNRTPLGADLYVDEEYQCHAPPRDYCVADVPAGVHGATIRFDDGDYIISPPFDVPPDMSVTLPVRDLMT